MAKELTADERRQRDVESVFQHMGLLDPLVRAQFSSDETVQVPMMNLRVVVSSSSNPFVR